MAGKLGTLEIVLKNATDLKDVETFVGRQDPYCVLACGKLQQRSKTHTDGGRNPTWNEKFLIPNVSGEHVLKIDIYDANLLLRDVIIGSCRLALSKIVEANAVQEMSLPVITKKNKHRGFVHLTLSFSLGETKSAPAPKPPPKPGNWILPEYADTDAWKEYEAGAVLGKGTFGTTYSATDRKTGEKVAIKVISKRKLTTPTEIEDVQREVQIMHHLSGHRNVCQLKGKGAYEDRTNVCIVMEQCTGGELFDAIVKRGHYTEKDAAEVMRTMVSVISHCHAMGVIHRDLKPENFLLSDKTPDAKLKATDFGLSTFYIEGQTFTDIVGSAYYVAPEVLKRRYSKEADIWSCGVILYILLCGFPPFHGDTEKKIFESVMTRQLDFSTEPWPRISEPAKDCVKRMLDRNAATRATAAAILQHDWLKENGVASSEPLQLEVLSRIKNFSAMNRLKKEALKFIAASLPEVEISGMRTVFKDMDRDQSGSITVQEFTEALRRKGTAVSDDELARILHTADVDGNGTIDYEEFLAATLHHAKLEREENYKAAFEHFDLDGNGTISRDELMQALKDLNVQNVEDIVNEVDRNGDGQIDYNEFCEMMRNM